MIGTQQSTNYHRLSIGLALALAMLPMSFASATPITTGQLVNIRVGNGTTTPAATGLPVTLDVYNVNYVGAVPTSVSLAQSIPLPTATSGTPPVSGDRYLTQGGTAAGEGGLTLSTNGNYMALGGYNNIVGGVTNGTGNSGQRVVGLLELSTGVVDTKTMYSDALTTAAIRNAFTTDGIDIWTSNSTNGVRHVVYNTGTNTSDLLTASNGPERRIYVYNGQLYTSRASAGPPIVFSAATVGSGTPISGAQTVTALPGTPASTNSPYDYFFADANTLYIADDRNTNTGGLEKWIFDGANWNQAYSMLVNPAGSNRGIKSLAGRVDGSTVTLFAATTDTTANYLYGFSDTLLNTSSGNVIANKLLTASTDFSGGAIWNLRGLAIAPGGEIPEPASITLVLLGALAAFARRSR